MYPENTVDRADNQAELKSLTDALARRDTEIKSWCEKASNEFKHLGKTTSETTNALHKLSENGIEINARLLEVEQRLARRNDSADAPALKSIGANFTDCEDFKYLAAKGRGIARLGLKSVTVTNITGGAGSAGSAVRAERVAGINAEPERPMTIRDLIMSGRTASNAIEYVRESGFQNNAAMVAEEHLKPQSALSFELVTTTVKTLAHWVRASKQVLADLPMLQSYIDGRLRYGLMYVEEQQILAGDGTGQNLLGLIPQATPFNDALRNKTDTPIDILRRAILQTRIGEYRASAIVLNPIDWAGIELQKDSTGQYLWVNVSTGGEPTMWRLPVVDTNAMPVGQFMVGAFNMAAQVFDREEANVEVSTEDGDNFTKNMVTIRAEERLGLAVFRPQSFVYGSFAPVGK